MEKEFDFNNIGKRMPYSTPDGFFDNFEDRLMERVNLNDNLNDNLNGLREAPEHQLERKNVNGNNSKKRRGIIIALRALVAAAACLALFFVVQTKFVKSSHTATDDFASVQLAFNNLSTEDQDFLIEVYEEDDFLSNEE